MAERVLVVKFGGSSFTEPGDYARVAGGVGAALERGYAVCLVVSAMSGTTGRLSELLHAVAPDPDAASIDAALATAEALASALMRAALVARGLEAVSLNGHQLGWIATEDFTKARIVDMARCSLRQALSVAPVVVVAGGQAETRDGRIAMLGRNSSDLTAVLCADSLGAAACTIVSDVEGVHTADPYLLSGTRILPALSYDLARRYAEAGAKVLHPECVAAAERAGVEIRCAAHEAGWFASPGTVIGREGPAVQIVLPKNAEIFEGGPASLFEADGLIGAAGTGDESVAVLLRHSPAWELAAANGLVPSEDRGAILCFDDKGVLEVHTAPAGALAAKAQAHHDRLTARLDLPAPRHAPAKAKSAFANVYTG